MFGSALIKQLSAFFINNLDKVNLPLFVVKTLRERYQRFPYEYSNSKNLVVIDEPLYGYTHYFDVFPVAFTFRINVLQQLQSSKGKIETVFVKDIINSPITQWDTTAMAPDKYADYADPIYIVKFGMFWIVADGNKRLSAKIRHNKKTIKVCYFDEVCTQQCLGNTFQQYFYETLTIFANNHNP